MREVIKMFYMAMFACFLIVLGVGGWRIDRDAKKKLRKIDKEPKVKAREDYWAA